ncbi:MAG: methionyl-tRNA formyltransferase [Sphingobacteriales bacterium]|nr:methionyl-tRNA formyltransferase [Sphingobacteriales bacterium]
MTSSPKDFRKLRIVFMGTPEFAVASLSKLVDAGCNIVAVITAPDKPAGRGMELQQSNVKKYALEKGLPLLQPEKLKDPAFIESLKLLNADLQVVVAFRMLPEMVWNMPPMGTINLHGSLLPQYRGAAPINWAIINGEPFTGVTTFLLQHDIDTGNILLAEKMLIGSDENAGELHDRMKETGATVLLRSIEELAAGKIFSKPQEIPSNGISLNHAPKIFAKDCEIDWNKTVDEVYNLVRGLSPYPTAFTYLDGKKCKLFAVEKIHTNPSVTPGTYDTDVKTFLRFACSDGYLDIKVLQIEGKKKMPVIDFLRGYRFPEQKR